MSIVLNIRTVFTYFGIEGEMLQYQNRKLEQMAGPLLSELEHESNRMFVFGATAPSGPWPPYSRGF